MNAIYDDIPYGDTSMTLEFLQSRAQDWAITCTAWNVIDRYQTIVHLEPGSLLALLAVLIVCEAFAGIQFTNMVWSFQVGFVAAFSLGMLSILIACLGSAKRPAHIIVAAVFAATIGLLGLGGGILAFPCIHTAAVLRRLGGPAIGIAITSFVLAVIGYSTAGSPSQFNPSPGLWESIKFALAFLGSPIAGILTNQYVGWPVVRAGLVGVTACLVGFAVLCVSRVYTYVGVFSRASAMASAELDACNHAAAGVA